MESLEQYLLLITPLSQNYRIKINLNELINSINVLKKIKETIHHNFREFEINKISYNNQIFQIAYDKGGIRKTNQAL